MRTGAWVLAAALTAACGRTPGPGSTPKETLRSFEAALKVCDVGATYDMLSTRTRARIDTAMSGVQAALAGVPDAQLEALGLDSLRDGSPRDMLVAAVDRARELAPEPFESLRSMHLVVLDVKQYGETARVRVSTLFQGREDTTVVPMVREQGRWFIDSEESFRGLPLDWTPAIEACVTPT